jgi:hypothetical protein
MSVPASRANAHGLEVSTSRDVVAEHGDGGVAEGDDRRHELLHHAR